MGAEKSTQVRLVKSIRTISSITVPIWKVVMGNPQIPQKVSNSVILSTPAGTSAYLI